MQCAGVLPVPFWQCHNICPYPQLSPLFVMTLHNLRQRGDAQLSELREQVCVFVR